MKSFAFLMTFSTKLLIGSLMVATMLIGRAADGTAQAVGGLVGAAATPVTTVSNVIGDPIGKAGKDATFRRDLADAKTLAKANNILSAEEILTRSNGFQKNTPEWLIETAQKLMLTAHDLSKEDAGSELAIQALAMKSLQHLSDVAAIAKDNATKSKAKASSAFIQDRYLGDPVAAIASYQAALLLSPNDPSSKEALDRLQKADVNLRAKIRAKTK